jgi:hypothetical protein
MVAMAVAMTAAMAVARRWRRRGEGAAMAAARRWRRRSEGGGDGGGDGEGGGGGDGGGKGGSRWTRQDEGAGGEEEKTVAWGRKSRFHSVLVRRGAVRLVSYVL